ncbi:MAG TPA: hypothetical protein VHG91_19970 [Longimicrobium sp.]|nr:hypothetical protein [Longimicrobium sp.]
MEPRRDNTSVTHDPTRREPPHAPSPAPPPEAVERGPLPARLIVPADPLERVRIIVGRQRR